MTRPTYRFGVVLHDERIRLSFAHEPLNEGSDAKGEAELDILGEISAKIIAIESIEDFKRLVSGNHVQSLLFLLCGQH